MKVKVSALTIVYNVLKKIIEEKRPLNTKAKYRITRMFSTIESEVQTIETNRGAIVMKLGVETFNEDGVSQGWQVSPEKMVEYQKEFSLLSEEEIEINCTPIPLSVLDAPAQVEQDGKMVDPITIQEILLLGLFIVDDME